MPQAPGLLRPASPACAGRDGSASGTSCSSGPTCRGVGAGCTRCCSTQGAAVPRPVVLNLQRLPWFITGARITFVLWQGLRCQVTGVLPVFDAIFNAVGRGAKRRGSERQVTELLEGPMLPARERTACGT